MTLRRSTILLVLILLSAAAIRFYRIDAQSLWSDEGSSVAQALRDLPAIVDNAARDIHPPLYYILLHFWVIPFGTSEAAVRALSALLGVALVALCYLLGTEIAGRRTGIVAALVATLNPFQVYYAQEARMYMLMALLGAVCVYTVLRALAPPPIPQTTTTVPPSRSRSPALDCSPPARIRWDWYIAYGLAAIMGLYTHYFFPIVLVIANAIFFIHLILARRHSGQAAQTALIGSLAAWLAVQAGVALTFLPWLPTALRQITTWPSGALTFAAGEAPLVILRTLAEGLSAPRGDGVWLALFVLLLVGALPLRTRRINAPRTDAAQAPVRPIGTVSVHDPHERGGAYQTAILLVYLLTPFAVMFALALFKDSFLKFMLVASPPFVLLVASGITRLSEAFAALAQRLNHPARSTNYVWRKVRTPCSRSGRPARGRSGGRSPLGAGMAHYASFILQPSAFILLLLAFPSIASLQNYYFDTRFARDDYRGIAAVIDALGHQGDASVLDAPGQQEIFSYYYKGALPVYPLPRRRPLDPVATEAELAAILARHSRLFVVFWATGESDPQQVVESWLDTHAFKADDSWYGNVRLAIYAAARMSDQIGHPLNVRWGDAITLQGYTLADTSTAAGDVLPLTLFWRAERPVAARYKVFVHLLDPRGFVVAQRDAEPVGGSRPTSGWKPGESLADPYGLFIPPATPPLSYTIEVGLYDPNGGERLRSPDGADHLLLGTVAVRPSHTLHAIPGMQPLNVHPPNGLNLLGYRLDKVGAEGQREAEIHPGDALHLVLFWQKGTAASADGAYRLQLGVLARQATPTGGLYPVLQWRDGEVVRDDQIISLPTDWQPGVYDLKVDAKTLTDVEVR